MAQWYVNELSNLVGVSVRTLHHYDRIGLLKPSLRLSNGYRIYSETDLLILQHIIALKFFGFTLAHIKEILKEETNLSLLLYAQRQVLQEKLEQETRVLKALDTVINQLQHHKQFDWNTIGNLIKGYQTMKNFEETWMKQAFSAKERKQYAQIWQQMSEKEMQDYGKRWHELFQEIADHIQEEPAGPTGRRLTEAWMKLVDEKYSNVPELKNAFQRAHEQHKIPAPAYMNQEIRDWIDKAFKKWGR